MKTIKMNQIRPLILADIRAGVCPMLLGEAGIGKSSIVESLGTEEKIGAVFSVPINQMADRADVTGARMMKNEQTGRWSQMFFPHATIEEAIQYAKDNPTEMPILFLDEINRASADITSTVMAFITTRRIGTENFPSNLRFVCAGNDTGNIVSLDDASITRFALYKVKPDAKTFLEVQSLNKFVETAISRRPDLINAPVISDEKENDEETEEDFMSMLDAEGSGFNQLTTPRTITYLSDFLNALGVNGSEDEKEKEVLNALMTDTNEDDECMMRIAIEGHIGHTALTDTIMDVLDEYFQKINSTAEDGLAKNGFNWEPGTHIVKALHEANAYSDIESIVLGVDDKEQFLLWLISGNGRQKVDNNASLTGAAEAMMEILSEFSDNFRKPYVDILMSESFDGEIIEILKKYPQMSKLASLTDALI